MSKNVLEFIAEGAMRDKMTNIVSYLRSALGKKKTPASKPTYSVRVRKKESKAPFKWEHLNPANQTRKEVMKAKAAYVLGAAQDGFNAGKAAGAAEVKKAASLSKRMSKSEKSLKKQKAKSARARREAKNLNPIDGAEKQANAKPDSWKETIARRRAPELKRVLKNTENLTPRAFEMAKALEAKASKRRPK